MTRPPVLLGCMKDILSVFDASGNWPAFFEEQGHNVMCLDLKNDPDAQDAMKYSCGHFFEELGIEWVDAILLAPPCTDFTNAGAQYWKRKDADGTTAAAVELVYQGLRCVEFWKPAFWVLENPIGRLPFLVPELGVYRMIFDPCDYAGWLDLSAEDLARLDVLRARDGKGRFSKADIDLVKRCNAYTKRTCLWGNFNLPEKRRVEPVKVCAQGSWLQKLGGKSEKTKEARSETPLGFARAFAAANSWTPANVKAWDLRRWVEKARDEWDMGPEDAEAAADLVEEEVGFDTFTRAEYLAAFGAAPLAIAA